MSESWEATSLGESVKLTKGVTYTSSEYGTQGDGNIFLTIKCVAKGGGFSVEGIKYYKGAYIPEQTLHKGDLVIALTDLTRDGDIVGSPLLVPDFEEGENALPSMDLAILRPIKKDVDLNFLFHRLMMHDARRYMLAHSAGTTVLHLERKSVQKFRFDTPKPNQQRHIAEILSTVDEAIEQTEALIKKTQQIKAGLMHDLFTRGVLPNGQLRPPREQAPELYRESPLGWIPKEWEVVGFTNLASFPNGQVNPSEYPFSNWILVAPDHIEKQTGRLLDKVTARDQGAISGKYSFQPEDILYSKIRPYLRKAILADFRGLCSADMYPLRPKPGIESRYLLGIILGEPFSRFTESVSMRSGFPKVNRNELLGFKCAIARDEEQKRISKMLNNNDNVISNLYEVLQKMFRLKNGLMNDLLSGRV